MPLNHNLAIYIHWPYCQSKCPYCDFNSHVADTIDHDLWAESYVRELNHIATMTQNRTITSIFFGGGTPSLMQPDVVETIINHIQKTWHIANNIEITLEANPTSIEANKFEAFKAAGINRVSIGVQSLRDADLKFLGRGHDAVQAVRAIDTAAKIFDRYSFDLIYARPEQSVAAWEAELAEAIPYTNGHLSLYQLTIEPGTPFYAQEKRGDFRIPEADQAGEFYEVTQGILTTASLPAYEVSNHAAAGQESMHNLTYWRYDDYAGIGPGAHGRLTIEGKKFATRARRAPEIWLEHVQKQGHGYHSFEEISQEDSFTEMMMMGLRLYDGVRFDMIEAQTNQDWRMMVNQHKLIQLVEEGLLIVTTNAIQPTAQGIQRLNAVLGYLL